MKPSILLVEDEAALVTLLTYNLEKSGFEVRAALDGEEAITMIAERLPDLVVLDWMLPKLSGLEICRQIRRGKATSRLPVVMLTAKGEEGDKLRGLEMGADDFITKPFSPKELIARIKAVLRRAQALPPAADTTEARHLRFAGWTLELARRQLVSPAGVVVPLSGGEYRLLRIFLDHPNRVLSRDQLLDLTRGREALPFDRSIDVQVGRLRRRLADEAAALIQTVRGEGYVLAAEVEAER